MTPSTADRIVIDSNVWISALVYGGNPRRVIELVVQQGTRVVMSEELLTEIRRVLTTKFPEFLADFEALYAALGNFITLVPLGAHTVTICRDPADNMVLETALAGQAQVVVSGDNDVLVLRQYRAIRIVTAANYASAQLFCI